MKRRENFILCQLGSTPYLLPFGQATANLQRGARINQTGVFLWNALENETSKETLLQKMIDKYQPSTQELPLLEQDLDRFLQQLNAYDMLSFSQTDAADKLAFVHQQITKPTVCRKTLEIGGIVIAWHGPTTLFPPEFTQFCKTESKTSCARTKQPSLANSQSPHADRPTFNILIETRAPYRPPVGQLLIHTPELMIVKSEQGHHCIYPRQCGLIEWRLSFDQQNAVLYCPKPWTQETTAEIFQAIRMIYLAIAQNYGLFALHSASVLYRGKAILFSGHSGAGKSTHAALWNNLYQAPLLNGDLNLIKLTAHGPLILGMPWCGTSGVCTTNAYALNAIVFIKQYPEDQLQTVSDEQKELAVLQRIISPTWTKEQFQSNLSFAKKLTHTIPIYKLKCTKNPAAAILCKKAIDKGLS